MLNPFKRAFSLLGGDKIDETGQKLSPEEIETKKKKLEEANARTETEEEIEKEVPVNELEDPKMKEMLTEYKKRQQELEGKKLANEDIITGRDELLADMKPVFDRVEGEDKRKLGEIMQNVARL